jgi:hypothetical protein
MTCKCKAEIEVEEQLFSWDAKKIRNPLVHKTNFRTVEESGINVRTIISGRESNATEIPVKSIAGASSKDETVPPDAIPSNEEKQKSQVRSIYYRCYAFTDTYLPEFTTP